MVPERKSTRIIARVPAGLLARVDFVVRNTESKTVKNRSAAVVTALETWLAGWERELEQLGVLPKKTR